jgi:hypothetical protein
VDRDEYDDLLRHLVRITAHQDTINEDLRECIRQQREANEHQREFNKEQLAINAAAQITLARIETLLARMIRQGGNGTDA